MADTSLRRLFALAATYQLTREERLDLATVLLRRDVYSWKSLTPHETSRLIDVLEGHALVQHLLETRVPT